MKLSLANFDLPYFTGRGEQSIECDMYDLDDPNQEPIRVNIVIEGYTSQTQDTNVIKFTLDDFRDFFNNIPNRRPESEDEYFDYLEDIELIQKAFKEKGFNISKGEAEMTHGVYSESVCASWLSLPYGEENLDGLFKEELPYLLQGLEWDKDNN